MNILSLQRESKAVPQTMVIMLAVSCFRHSSVSRFFYKEVEVKLGCSQKILRQIHRTTESLGTPAQRQIPWIKSKIIYTSYAAREKSARTKATQEDSTMKTFLSWQTLQNYENKHFNHLRQSADSSSTVRSVCTISCFSSPISEAIVSMSQKGTKIV